MFPSGSNAASWFAEVVLYLPPDLPAERWTVEVTSGSLTDQNGEFSLI